MKPGEKNKTRECEHRGVMTYKNMTPIRCWNCGKLITETTKKPNR